MAQPKSKKSGKLFVVALPIGQPKDITLRALEILKEVDVIAAEDTREFKKLCSDLNLSPTKVLAYHEHNEEESSQGLFKLLSEGKNLALVSDAGTPNISDPGHRLLKMAFENEVEVIPLPGASSVIAALSVCPLGGIDFYFGGFLAAKTSARKKSFLEHKSLNTKLVYFESPHRIVEHLQDALEVFKNIEVFVARELTKTHEELFLGTITQAIEKFAQPKGEFVVIYSPPAEEEMENLDEWLKNELSSGKSPRDLLKEAQKLSKLSRKDLFDKIQKLKESSS